MRMTSLALALALGMVGGAGLAERALAQGDAQLPDVETPDFAEADAVLESVEEMIGSMQAVKDAEGWRALRAIDECETVEDMIEDKVTAAAYDADSGERSWTLCHKRYESLKLH